MTSPARLITHSAAAGPERPANVLEREIAVRESEPAERGA
jgi:hypothetical protein